MMQISNVEISNKNLSISVNAFKIKQYDLESNTLYIQKDLLIESSAIAMNTNTIITKTVPESVRVSA